MSSVGPWPESGPGRVAGFGVRVVAFLIDAAIANVLAVIVGGGYHRSNLQSTYVLVFFLLIELLFVTFASQTPGMRVMGIAVVRADGQGRPAFRWALLRTLLIATVLPALFTDASGRAMHDRAAGTVMLRTR
ncbi:MAG TPA: RDD family protein [Mycobacteriales bacterium]|nr:RDD family protein [Mycobacteriales bacterium]